MLDEQLVVTAITKFREAVEFIESLFTDNFQINVSPLVASSNNVIPKSGYLKVKRKIVATYQFHGKGCRVSIGTSIIDYDYCGSDFRQIIFSGWNLLEFIKSSDEFDFELTNEEDFDKALELIERKGIIERMEVLYGPYKL